MTDFAVRHIGPTPAEQGHMLGSLGFSSLDELTTAALPAGTPPAGLHLPDPLTETEALAELRRMAGRNQVLTSMIGLGYYDTITPAVIRRNVLENPAWYTAYTPYQPEISQGRLEALLNFQTMVADLTGLPWAGASLLDEATAAVEAMTLARRAAKKGHVFLADADCLPQTLAVLRTRAEPLGIHLVVEPVTPEAIARLGGDLFGVLLQFPGASGVIRDPAPLIEAAHAAGALAAVAADLLALTLLRPPGEAGADVAVGSTQRLGVPLWFGGPHAGYIAVSDALKRQLPGRLVGVSVDADGRPAYRLALQAREQHIRREKATSNICTAQVLLAVTAAMYAAYHGPDGLAAIARGVHRSAAVLAATLRGYGHRTSLGDFFDTIRIVFAGGRDEAAHALERARVAGYNLYLAPDDALQVSCDETTTDAQLRALVAALCFVADPADVELSEPDGELPGELRRTSEFLTHPVFSEHRSETAMLRYLRRLADFDIALDRSMIPLGSCTMKLNAAAEMEPVSWPEFARMHPFAPAGQAGGYLELIESLELRLARLTGYDAVSVQPNAGSQGELAGLLAIRGYHASRGEQSRDVCLIPESAHGTNAASAVLAGLRVAVVKCDADGAVDLGDLQAKLEAHEGHVAAIMITYPSTAGVYEQNVSDICAAVHAAGGQVYIDGANLNALVGVANLPRVRRRRVAPEPAQDVLHPARRRRPRRRAGGGPRAPGGLPARPRQRGPGRGRALRIGRHPAHLLGLRRDDGSGRAEAGDPGRGAVRQLRREAPGAALPGPVHRAERPGRARMRHRPAAAGPRNRDHRGRRGQAADRLRVPRPDDVVPGGRHAHDRAHREREPGRDRPVLRRADRDPGGDRPGGLRRVRRP